MIVIADIHMGKTNDSFVGKGGVLSQVLDIRKRLATVLARAKLTKQCIVIAGDIFNRVNPTTQTISEFFDWLNSCRTAKVNVYLIGGNHDAGVDWTSMSMFRGANLPNITVITEPAFVSIAEGTGVERVVRAVLLWPHLPAATRELMEQGHGNVSRAVSVGLKNTEFVITHGTIFDGYKNDIFFEAGESMRIDPGEFPNLKLLVAGHIHDHSSGSDGLWVYPGSLTINNFGEVNERKGWVEVALQDLTWEWFEFPEDVTPWVHVELDLTEKDETTLDEKAVKELVDGAVVKITVIAKAHGIINEVYIRELFNKYGHVSRFETVVTGEGTEVTKETKQQSTEELLAGFLSGTDATANEKAHALLLGKKIITEVHA